jgi:hypothetical protein
MLHITFILSQPSNGVTYKDGFFWIGHWICWTVTAITVVYYSLEWRSRQFTIHSTIAISRSLSVVHCTYNESSWPAIPLVLGYRVPTAVVPLTSFPNYPRAIVTATLDSQGCH